MLDLQKDKLPDVNVLKERIAFHENCLQQMEESGKSFLVFTDPKTNIMPVKEDDIMACFNVQMGFRRW